MYQKKYNNFSFDDKFNLLRFVKHNTSKKYEHKTLELIECTINLFKKQT